MRCPKCGSRDTKRNGKTATAPATLSGVLEPLQRFLCSGCQSTFTLARTTARAGAQFSNEVIEEGVRRYVQGLTSYRVLATMLSDQFGRTVGRFTLNGWVHELGDKAKTALQVSNELAPTWGGSAWT